MSGHRFLITRAASDNKVKNAFGRDIGRVEEILIDPLTGKTRYAIIAFGAFFGDGDRMLAVPWRTLDLDAATSTYTLCVDRSTLRHAPKFDRHERARLSADDLHRIEAHYASSLPSNELTAA